jgi:hypothetical protein
MDARDPMARIRWQSRAMRGIGVPAADCSIPEENHEAVEEKDRLSTT